VDLTLKHVKIWTSAGAIDFDNSLRKTASTIQIPFVKHHQQVHNAKSQLAEHTDDSSVLLKPGSYLVDFNETVDVPLDLMGQIFVRSSLFRSGALLSAGVMDSGYKGAVGAMLQVVNPHGLLLFRDARLAQIVFHPMSEPFVGYSGAYQGSTTA